MIEALIFVAILGEIGWSIYDRWKQNKQNNESLELLKGIKEILEDSNAELADIRDETVEDEDGESRS